MAKLLSAIVVLLFCIVRAAHSVTNYTSGEYTISYDDRQLPMLRVYSNSHGLVWFSATSEAAAALVSAAQISENVTQIGGNFIFDKKVLQVCTDMTITKTGSVPPANPKDGFTMVFFEGTLCNKEVSFRLSFQDTIVSSPSSGTEDQAQFHHLRFNATLDDPSHKYNQLRLVYGCEEDEQMYGFGAQYSKFNVKEQRLPVFLSEQGVGRGLQPLTFILNRRSPGAGGSWYTTYTSVPHYITSYSRSLVLESPESVVFDMTDAHTVTIEIDSDVITGRIISGNSPKALISSYTAFAGRMKPLPQWVNNGAVLGLQGGTTEVLKTLQQVKEANGNLSDVAAVWLQDWTGQHKFNGKNDLPRVGLWWNWEVDSSYYTNWTNLITDLASKGIKTLTYINPLFSNVSLRGSPYQHNYYYEGLAKDYFVRKADGSVWLGYSNSTLADLSNPAAYQWMVDMIAQNMVLTGVCGWMCDFGESLPLDASLKSGDDSDSIHTLYPSLWAQVNQDAIKKASQTLNSTCTADDIVFFMRSGNILSPSVSRAFWLGDQMVTWDAHDGLATVVIGMLSEGLSGFSHTHSDIGGYTAIDYFPISYIRQKELFMRWCEVAAFSTMYRSHLGTLPDKNWQFNSDKETLQQFFKMAVLFKGLSEYRSRVMEETYHYGWPVARHMILNFPNNSKVYTEDLTSQFMLGDQYIVAPVLKKGATSVSIFLPTGTAWQHFWTGQKYKGSDDFVTIAAPIGQPCFLFVEGSTDGKKLVTYMKQRNLM